MYLHAKAVDWCQCCTRGVSLTDLERSSNFLGDHNTPQIVHPTNNACCFPISFSFSVGNDLCVVPFFVLQCGTARRPFPTIILQITLLVSVKQGDLYCVFILDFMKTTFSRQRFFAFPVLAKQGGRGAAGRCGILRSGLC